MPRPDPARRPVPKDDDVSFLIALVVAGLAATPLLVWWSLAG